MFKPVPEYLRKANRVKAVVVFCMAVTFALVAVFVGFFAQYAKASGVMLETQSVMPGVVVDPDGSPKDDNPSQQVFAPNLLSLLGKKADVAVAGLEHGAVVVDKVMSLDEKAKLVTTYQVALTNEPADKMAGAPMVYLTANSNDVVIEAGYQAGMWYLGYGSLSMSDAVENVHVVEKVLSEAGLSVPEGNLTLPEDSATYSVFGSDGVTIVSQECSFSGQARMDGAPYSWRAVINYDYADANAKSNLAYTVRKISVYVSAG